MNLAQPVLVCLVVLSLTGCTASATSTASPSTGSHPSSTPNVPATPAIVDGLPSSCDVLFAGLKKFVSPDGSLVLDPAWKSGPGQSRAASSGYGTYDPILADSLSKDPGLICDWAPRTGPSDTFLTTQLRHVDAATQQAAIDRMKEIGWSCSESYGGEWCLTNDSHTGRSIGESQYLGHGDWLASDWNNAGPETYTPELLKTLFR